MTFKIGQVAISWTSKGIGIVIPIEHREIVITMNVTPDETIQLDVRLTVADKISSEVYHAE